MRGRKQFQIPRQDQVGLIVVKNRGQENAERTSTFLVDVENREIWLEIVGLTPVICICKSHFNQINMYL